MPYWSPIGAHSKKHRIINNLQEALRHSNKFQESMPGCTAFFDRPSAHYTFCGSPPCRFWLGCGGGVAPTLGSTLQWPACTCSVGCSDMVIYRASGDFETEKRLREKFPIRTPRLWRCVRIGAFSCVPHYSIPPHDPQRGGVTMGWGVRRLYNREREYSLRPSIIYAKCYP